MEILIFSLIGWSITSVVVNGSIFDPLRNYLLIKSPFFGKLISCMQCSGFWVGIFLGLLSIFGIIYHPLSSLFILSNAGSKFLMVLTYGFFISGISVILNAVLVYLLTQSGGQQSE